MTSDIEDYKLVLTVLCYALIEIRAAETLQKAQTLADVFHNVPNGIALGRSPEDIRAKLDQTANRLGCQNYINSLSTAPWKNMEKESLS